MRKASYNILLLDAPQSIWKWFDGTLPSPALAILASYSKSLYNLRVLDLNIDKSPLEHYKIPIYGGKETFGMTFSRGCRNKCCFCSESFGWEYTLRKNSPQYAVKHIELLHDVYNRKSFIFADTDFLIDPKSGFTLVTPRGRSSGFAGVR